MGPQWGLNIYIRMLRNVLFKDHLARKAETVLKASSGCVNSNMSRLIFPRVKVGTQQGWKYIIKILFLKTETTKGDQFLS